MGRREEEQTILLLILRRIRKMIPNSLKRVREVAAIREIIVKKRNLR